MRYINLRFTYLLTYLLLSEFLTTPIFHSHERRDFKLKMHQHPFGARTTPPGLVTAKPKHHYISGKEREERGVARRRMEGEVKKKKEDDEMRVSEEREKRGQR